MRDLERIGRRQYGLVTRAQLFKAGRTAHEVRGLLRHGTLLPMHPGVYRLVGSSPAFPQPVLAAILAMGNGWASHESAARLLRLPGFLDATNHSVSVPHGARGGRFPVVAVVRTRVASLSHVRRVNGVPTTDAARTICDLSTTLTAARLEQLIDTALTRRHADLDRLAATFDSTQRHGRKGQATLRRLLAERDAGGAMAESELEARFLRLIDQADLPRPDWQRRPAWLRQQAGRVDGIYPRIRFVVELDGRAWHSRDLDRDRDLRRDHAATMAGWHVVRFSWRQVVHDGGYVVAVLRALLGLPDSEPASTPTRRRRR